EDYLSAFGVADIIARTGDIAAATRERYPNGVDALLDTVSYMPGAYDAALKDGARVASTNNAAGESPGRTNVMAMPTTDNLRRLAQLLDSAALEVPIQQTYPLDQAAAAMNALSTTHTRGKLAVNVA
ncbi:MAG: zinc-binding dehydrogenase, partial [Gaiellaceae bacterium]